MTFNVRTANLAAINSATKYPSIPTYHTLDPKNGNLLDEAVKFVGDVFLTEKLDGTNARVILLPDDTYLLGSREELLYAQGDLIGNPAQGIVDALRNLADGLGPRDRDSITVFYLEVYGGRVTPASRNYTGSQRVGFRLFDVAKIPLDVLEWPRERIASWRDNGGQVFHSEDGLALAEQGRGIELVPRLDKVDAADLPTGIDETRDWLATLLPSTFAALDDEAKGRAEGIVLRDAMRSVIAKARFQDYDRTLKRRGR